jgi:hypothetical protein
MNTRAILILTAILLFGVLVTMGLVSQSTSDTKTDSSKTAEGATGLGAKRARAAQSKPPTVNVEKSDSQPAAGEKVEASEIREIRQALSELQALQKGVGSNQQIQEKKAALKAAIESGINKDPNSVISLLLGLREDRDVTGYQLAFTDYVRLFVQSAPELALALLDQVPEQDLDWVVKAIGDAWAKSDPKAALAWANQQTDSKVKDYILEGLIPSLAITDLQGAVAYLPLLSPGASEEKTIPEAFRMAAYDDFQGALAVMQSLPEGRIKDLASQGVSHQLSNNDPQAAWDLALGIADSNLRAQAQEKVVEQWCKSDSAAVAQWIQSLPVGDTKDRASAGATTAINCLTVGPTKDLAASGIIQSIAENDPQNALGLASRIFDSNLRTQALKTTAESWLTRDPAAATQWINSFATQLQSLPQADFRRDGSLLGISQGMARNDPQAAMDMASGIGDSNLRTEAQKNVVEQWSKKDPAAAIQWINSSALPQEVRTQLLLQR